MDKADEFRFGHQAVVDGGENTMSTEISQQSASVPMAESKVFRAVNHSNIVSHQNVKYNIPREKARRVADIPGPLKQKTGEVRTKP